MLEKTMKRRMSEVLLKSSYFCQIAEICGLKTEINVVAW